MCFSNPVSSPAVNFACRLHARASIHVRARYRPHAHTRCVQACTLCVPVHTWTQLLALRTHALRARSFTAATPHVLNRKDLKINILYVHGMVQDEKHRMCMKCALLLL